jgi:hypothetical protein
MIRFQRLPLELLDTWLANQRLANTHPTYQLRIWRENRAGLDAIRCVLINYVNEAHDDARRRICQGFEDDLSPFNNPPNNPAANYPSLLHRVTLQGYFGETLAGLAVEHWGAHGYMDWVVPAFLFRLHNQEFQHLDTINERLAAGELYDPDTDAELRPGRTGDDCIAFRMNAENTITDVLTIEAKCIGQNSNSKIQDAHQKLAAGSLRPSGILELINLLNDYETPEAQIWQQALLHLWKGGYRAVVRYDAVAYACGQIPRRQVGRVAWMPADAPHPAYTVNRRLEGLEFQFDDLQTVIDMIYRGG